MTYPLVRDLADDGIPVTVTCRVLGCTTQGFYKWCANPVSSRDWDDAHLINAIIAIHLDDPEFGYRFIADELAAAGHRASENRVQRLCALQQIASSILRKRRGSGKTPGPPVHDDHVNRIFHAETLDQIWLTDISEHPTSEGKLYICAVKDVCSRKIVGYAIGPRMTSQLADAALRTAIARRRPTGTVVVHSDYAGVCVKPRNGGFACAGGGRWVTPSRDHHLDRTHLPPSPTATRARPSHPRRVRSTHRLQPSHPSSMTPHNRRQPTSGQTHDRGMGEPAPC